MKTLWMKLAVLALLFTALCPQAWAQTVPEPAAQQAQKLPPTFVQFRKTVVFLRTVFVKQGRLHEIRGTGFFLHVEDSRLPKGRVFPYLVTNRHMVEPSDDEGNLFAVHKIFVRLNLLESSGGAQSVEGPLPEGVKWNFHANPSVDLAVTNLVLDKKKYDVLGLPSSMLAAKEQIESENVAEGDEVAYAGYFAQYSGNRKIQPLVREGIIAMMPDEELPTTLSKPGRVYMADVHVFGGNSGSPMLVSLGGFRGGSMLLGERYLLLGVVSGYYTEEHDFTLRAATVLSGRAESNSGITIVVPAFQLKELIEQPELQAFRDTAVRQLAGNNPK